MEPDMLRQRLVAALNEPGRATSDFDLNPQASPTRSNPLSPAAVLVAVSPNGMVTLTKRSSRLKHHPGQIAFPGGKVDATDQDAVSAALREAAEEVNLPSDYAEILGTLPPHETVTGFEVTPVLALLSRPFVAVPETGEVAEIFDVPLAHVADPQRFSVQGRIWQGQMRHYYTVPWGPYYIWGATARILRELAERLNP